MPAETLVPGYKQVEEFGPDEEYEEEEEIYYVTLDLGTVQPTLLPNCSTYRLIGLDTPTPYLQLAGSVFEGRHDSLLGTELLFTEDKGGTDGTKPPLSPFGTAEQRICFKEVQLKQKVKPRLVEGSEVPSTEPPSNEDASIDISKASTSAAAVTESDQYLEKLTGRRSASPTRKRKRGSKKGKEKAVEIQDDNAMNMS